MNEAEVQAKLEHVEQLTTKLTELFNQVATAVTEVTVLLQAVTERLDATQEPKLPETKEGAKKWYLFDLISMETMSMSDFCKHTSFLEECNRLKASPKFERMITPYYNGESGSPNMCILKNVTVSEDWLEQHAVDDKKLLYYVGDLTFYTGTRIICLGEH